MVISPFVGSFLALSAYRIPRKISVVRPRSRCSRCHAAIRGRDLIPVLSFFLLKGRCRHCHAPFGVGSLVIEAAAIGVALIAVYWTEPPVSLLAAGLGWLLLLMAAIDFENLILPDVLVVALAGGAFIDMLVSGAPNSADRFLGAIIGGGVFWGIALGYEALRGRVGLGFGDVKFVIAAGLWLGWQKLPMMIVLAGIFGIGQALFQARKRGVTTTTVIPLGTWMALALWVIWLENHGQI